MEPNAGAPVATSKCDKKWVIAIVVVIVVAVGAWWLASGDEVAVDSSDLAATSTLAQ